MPIEIMELVVKAKVGDNGNDNSTEKTTSTESGSQNDPKVAALERAVKETTNIIKRKNER
jgi:hypothetical protein